MSTYTPVFIAAGLGRRHYEAFGGKNRFGIPIDGIPTLQRVYEAVRETNSPI
ncbi:hypothetical protein HZB02_06600 [Candidatus Woesearchaeota archaeon]|nr:hypothetical protein [Candidatus Woesearchaeota archaeon]